MAKKPKMPTAAKKQVKAFMKKVEVEFKGFVPATSIDLTAKDYKEILDFFFDPKTNEIRGENKELYFIMHDKEQLEVPDEETGELETVIIDRGWGTNLYACFVTTMDEVSEVKRTPYNDWWPFPDKEKSNRKFKIPDEDNQHLKGLVKCAAAAGNQLAVWAAMRQIAKVDYSQNYIFIGTCQFQWGRKTGEVDSKNKATYENCDSTEEMERLFKENPSRGAFKASDSMDLTEFLE